MMATLLLASALSAPPIDTTIETRDYPTTYELVRVGQRVVFFGTPPGLPTGTYDCWLIRGVPHMQIRPETGPYPLAAPACPGGQCPVRRTR